MCPIVFAAILRRDFARWRCETRPRTSSVRTAVPQIPPLTRERHDEKDRAGLRTPGSKTSRECAYETILYAAITIAITNSVVKIVLLCFASHLGMNMSKPTEAS